MKNIEIKGCLAYLIVELSLLANKNLHTAIKFEFLLPD